MRWQFGFFSDDVGNFIHLQSISVHLRRQTRQASQKYGQSMYDVVSLLRVIPSIWANLEPYSKKVNGKKTGRKSMTNLFKIVLIRWNGIRRF